MLQPDIFRLAILQINLIENLVLGFVNHTRRVLRGRLHVGSHRPDFVGVVVQVCHRRVVYLNEIGSLYAHRMHRVMNSYLVLLYFVY